MRARTIDDWTRYACDRVDLMDVRAKIETFIHPAWPRDIGIVGDVRLLREIQHLSYA